MYPRHATRPFLEALMKQSNLRRSDKSGITTVTRWRQAQQRLAHQSLIGDFGAPANNRRGDTGRMIPFG